MKNRDAIDLARFVLNATGPLLPEDVVADLISDPTATRRVALDCKVSLEVRYDLVEVRDSMIEVHSDVYRRGIKLREEVIAALGALGYTKERIDSARLDGFLLRRARPTAKVRIDSLLVSPRRRSSPATSPRN